MSLLLAMTGWHVEDWRARFQALLPDMPIVVLGEPFDRRAVHYVASWKHPPGSLTGQDAEALFAEPSADGRVLRLRRQG